LAKFQKYFDNLKNLFAVGGSPHFSIKASKGLVIGSSQMYSCTSAMEIGITSAMNNAQQATVGDNS